jgi:hypothetical protein
VELRGENFVLEDLSLVSWSESHGLDAAVEVVKSERGAITIQLLPLEDGLIIISPMV